MFERLKYLGIGLLLTATVYVKFFNEKTAEMIANNDRLQAILAFIIFYFVITFAATASKYFYNKTHHIPSGKKNNVHFGIENIANVILSVGFFLLILSMFGVKPLELITSLTIVAAAFAILTKEFIVDFLSGIYLSFSNTFEINDYVKIDHQKGKIAEISMLKVKLLNDDDDLVIMPNAKVHTSEIVNYTKSDVRLMTIDFQIGLKNISNIEQLESEIIKSLESFSSFIEPESYLLKVVEVKMDYLELKFQYRLITSNMDLVKKIRKRTIRQVFSFIASRR